MAAAVGKHPSVLSPAPEECGGPQPTTARQGRHKQLYAATGERLVAGSIPVRIREGGAGPDAVEVLLLSSRAGGFCFPKGGWEDDETLQTAAKRETLEEAGVRGILEEPMLGQYPFVSGKGNKGQILDAGPHQGRCIANMYVLHVAEVLETWPEGGERSRTWLPLAKACSLARAEWRHEWMMQALHAWVRRKGWDVSSSNGSHAQSNGSRV